MKACISLFFILILLNAHGQDFSVSPAKINFATKPGTEQTKTLSIMNNSNKKQTIQLSNRDFIVLKSGDKKILSPKSTDQSIAEWLTYSPSYFSLNPNESRNIEITLSAPTNNYMAHWGIIDVSPAKERTSLSADKNLETGLMLTGRISVLVTYNPLTNSDFNVKINNLKEVTSDKSGKRKFTAEVDNLGNRIIRCESYLMVTSLKSMEDNRFTPIKFTSYPKTSFTVTYYLPADLAPGKYSVAAILDFGSKNKLEGTQTTITVK